MPFDRRAFIVTVASGALATTLPGLATPTGNTSMYGLIGKMLATPGQRDALISILLEGIHDMPGCLSYVVARDLADENAIWITEVWDDEASHKASLSLPSVRQAITKAKPLIAGFGDHVKTAPAGGHGLPK
ncbi:putative quinol monooxygenase [Lysobacter sp.]|uniref:putative quinol monooxygenase n=1 Tax=Lysobacter sp. TaxID=72226 RepID=UPI002D73DBBC|nr:putative quinol monooxygenase [Lysobacter sp.]HZX77366.1 putative quinol monooxygenase [Lysobacter sp.]